MLFPWALSRLNISFTYSYRLVVSWPKLVVRKHSYRARSLGQSQWVHFAAWIFTALTTTQHLLCSHIFSAISHRLDHLWAEGNGLTGTIPTELGLCRELGALTLLTSSFLSLIAPFDFLSQLSPCIMIEVISLYENSLNGTFPNELVGLTNLRESNVANNSNLNVIHWFWRHNISLFVATVTFRINQNGFVGTVPSGIGLLTNLCKWMVVILSSCATIVHPSIILSSPFNKDVLFLHENTWTGTIPTEIGLLTGLSKFSLLPC